jgi:hypothetical protein
MYKVLLFPVLLLVLVSCNNREEYKPASDPQEAAREFIRASLDGNYQKARFYLYKDSAGVNDMLLQKWEKDYSHWNSADKSGHKDANILVITTTPVDDSTLNYVFSNTYKKDTTTIKIVRSGGQWLVDLKDIH